MGTRNGRMLRLATQGFLVLGLAVALLTIGVKSATGQAGAPQDGGQPPKGKAEPPKGDAKKAASKTGLLINDPRAFQGYTLFAPLMGTKTYLIDMQGHVVRSWDSKCNPAASAYLLDNGHLLRT